MEIDESARCGRHTIASRTSPLISVLSKPADQIGVADIQDLISSQVPEGEQIEFKGSLPTDDGSPDRWVTHGDRIGRRAKHTILEESVAFANAYSGALVLGVAESDAIPPVAERTRPIPKCADLAERLNLVFRDGVEPLIPSLEIIAVPTEGASGVVIIRVGRSRMAPHRVKSTRHCTIRRADRCERMSMREIQDLTLNLSRGSERIRQRFAERARSFSQEFERLESTGYGFGFRVTGVPVTDHIAFDQVYGVKALYRPPIRISLFGSPGVSRPPSDSWRPSLRSARSEFILTRDSNRCIEYEYEEVHCDGLVECGMVSSQREFETAIPVRYFAITAFWSDLVRRLAHAPWAEYALEFEVSVRGWSLPVRLGYRFRNEDGAGCNERQYNRVGELRQSPVEFPIYSLAESSDLRRLVAIFERDFWNSIGVDFGLHENAFLIEEDRSGAIL